MKSRQPAQTKDGSYTLYDPALNEHYHSIHGALQESTHVFIEKGLKQFTEKKSISIFEMGFGTGLNAYLSYLEGRQQKKTIHYVSVEAHPIQQHELDMLNYHSLLKEENSSILEKMHHQKWNGSASVSNTFTLYKRHANIEAISAEEIRQCNQGELYDLIYFDAFSPTSQPELWNECILSKMHQILTTGGLLTTYCAKGSVKRTLKKIGFEVVSVPGPPGKREMTHAIKR